MAVFREGKVVEVVETTENIIRVTVETEAGKIEAIGYPEMLGPLHSGNRVVVNTTGLDLDLGTGGAGFILWNRDAPSPKPRLDGHIMKLRYTPWQLNVMAAEAPESPHHDELADFTDLEGSPVVACGLHSQVPAVAAGIKAARPNAKVGYLMTDGGALPLAFSNLVRQMREANLIDATCTSGHAFGGDLEAVNIFSGMAALRTAASCDVVIAAMGPGVVGTGSKLGYTGIEQGQLLDAATALGGTSIAALRTGFDDDRDRHHVISHHSITALTLAARERCKVAVPKLSPERSRELAARLSESGICDRHEAVTADGRPGVRLLLERELNPTSMGRRMSEAPELWLAGAAAGAVATEHLQAPG